MNNWFLSILFVFLIVVFAFQSCEEDENETKISSFNSDDSHNTGQNCMNCHTGGGSGEGVFTVAGTVYNNSQLLVYPNATVKLYSDANRTGDPIATVEVDSKGNFYTTETFNFDTGLYVSVIGNTATKNMISSLTTGACNSCHGVSLDPIWTE